MDRPCFVHLALVNSLSTLSQGGIVYSAPYSHPGCFTLDFCLAHVSRRRPLTYALPLILFQSCESNMDKGSHVDVFLTIVSNISFIVKR